MTAQIHQYHVHLFHANGHWSPYIYHENMNFKSLSNCLHPTYISKFTSWILHSIGLLHVYIKYEMAQLQHYSVGQQILDHMYFAM